jgi:integrase
VERLLHYQNRGDTVYDKQTQGRLDAAHPKVLPKLAEAGLITLVEPVTLKELWNSFLTDRKGVKLNTMKNYLGCQRLFFQTFLPTEFVDTLTRGRLLDWKQHLLSRYAEAGVVNRFVVINTLCNWAVSQGILSENPVCGIHRGKTVNRDKRRRITMAEFGKLLDVCPNREWRVIITLARIGGLRCPSELMELRWSDIIWDRCGFWVRSSKTERHVGHEKRYVPLFQEIRTELEQLRLSVDPKDDDFVIQSFQGKPKWNLHPRFQTIACKAGLETIPAPFLNMRKDRCNEVREQHGPKEESRWMGHSEKMMKKHYLDPREAVEEDYSGIVNLNG